MGIKKVLVVEVVEAKGLAEESDAYCVVTSNISEDFKAKTPVIKKTLDPKWSETIILEGVDHSNPVGDVIVSVYHSRLMTGGEFLGQVVVGHDTLEWDQDQTSSSSNNSTPPSSPILTITNTNNSTTPPSPSPLPRSPRMLNYNLSLATPLNDDEVSFEITPRKLSPRVPPLNCTPVSPIIDKWYDLVNKKDSTQQPKNKISGQLHLKFYLTQREETIERPIVPSIIQFKENTPTQSHRLSLTITQKDRYPDTTVTKLSLGRLIRTKSENQIECPPELLAMADIIVTNNANNGTTIHNSLGENSSDVGYRLATHGSNGSSGDLKTNSPGDLKTNGTSGDLKTTNSSDLKGSGLLTPSPPAITRTSRVVSAPATRELDKTFAQICPPEILSLLTKEERQRQEVLLELVNTERVYLKDLNIMNKVFIQPLASQTIISNVELESIFTNTTMLISIHENILEGLEAKQKEGEGMIINCIGDLFLSKIDALQAYSVHCSNQPLIPAKLEKLCQKNKNFKSFLDEANARPELRQLSLMGFLIKPLQRLTRYPLLIKEVLKSTATTHPDHPSLSVLMMRISELVTSVNEATRLAEQQAKGAETLSLIDKGEEIKSMAYGLGVGLGGLGLGLSSSTTIADQSPIVIREGPIRYIKNLDGTLKKKDWYCFLFQHAFILVAPYTNKKDKENTAKYQLMYSVPLGELILSDLTDTVLTNNNLSSVRNAFEVIHISENIYMLTTSSLEEKTQWMTDIETATTNYHKNHGADAGWVGEAFNNITNTGLENNSPTQPLVTYSGLVVMKSSGNMSGSLNQIGMSLGLSGGNGAISNVPPPTSGGFGSLTSGVKRAFKGKDYSTKIRLLSLEKHLRVRVEDMVRALKYEVVEKREKLKLLQDEIKSYQEEAEKYKLEAEEKEREKEKLKGEWELEKSNLEKMLKDAEVDFEIRLKNIETDAEKRITVALLTSVPLNVSSTTENLCSECSINLASGKDPKHKLSASLPNRASSTPPTPLTKSLSVEKPQNSYRSPSQSRSTTPTLQLQSIPEDESNIQNSEDIYATLQKSDSSMSTSLISPTTPTRKGLTKSQSEVVVTMENPEQVQNPIKKTPSDSTNTNTMPKLEKSPAKTSTRNIHQAWKKPINVSKKEDPKNKHEKKDDIKESKETKNSDANNKSTTNGKPETTTQAKKVVKKVVVKKVVVKGSSSETSTTPSKNDTETSTTINSETKKLVQENNEKGDKVPATKKVIKKKVVQGSTTATPTNTTNSTANATSISTSTSTTTTSSETTLESQARPLDNTTTTTSTTSSSETPTTNSSSLGASSNLNANGTLTSSTETTPEQSTTSTSTSTSTATATKKKPPPTKPLNGKEKEKPTPTTKSLGDSVEKPKTPAKPKVSTPAKTPTTHASNTNIPSTSKTKTKSPVITKPTEKSTPTTKSLGDSVEKPKTPEKTLEKTGKSPVKVSQSWGTTKSPSASSSSKNEKK